MDLVTIEEVQRHERPECLLGCSLDAPQVGAGHAGFAFDVAGWALGRDSAVEALQVLDGERVIASAPPNRQRPDVASKLAGRKDIGALAEQAVGFEVGVSALALGRTFAVEAAVCLADGRRAPLATLRGRRERLQPPGGSRLNPVMLTTIGRSGSKWLTWLLSCHPEIVAFEPLTFEPRVATYWMTVLRSLATPESYERQLHTDHWDRHWWLGDGASPMPAPVKPWMDEWLGVDALEQTASMCRARIEAFYDEVAARCEKRGAHLFAEKFLLDPTLLGLTHECFGGAREVILVRDFRDRLSSVFAWNERRGEHGFGHDGGMSKARYVADHVLADARELLERWRRAGDAAQLVHYERLVLEPRATLAALFGHLGVAADDDTVEAVLEAATGARGLDAHRTVSDPVRTIGRWRRDLPEELARECNTILAPVLDAFGYATETTAWEQTPAAQAAR